jgi:tetrahydromethanopterin S-methyltransferase subunit B
MLFPYWLVLFSIGCASNVLGLNISSTFKNVVTIYILIPLILVPQMLLGGAMIKFEDIYPPLTSKKYVPVIGDLMFSRWAYEALAVEQFCNNKFEQYFFDIDKEKSEALYISAYYIPELKLYVQKCEEGITKEEYKNSTIKYINVLKNELYKLESLPETEGIKFEHYEMLEYDKFDKDIATKLYNHLEIVKKLFNTRSNDLNKLKDKKYNELVAKYGQEEIIELKKQYYNDKLADFVMDKMQIKMLQLVDDDLVRKKDPIFQNTENKFGRAHFYATQKYIGNFEFSTLVFNMIVLWLFIVILYITLYFEIFKKIVESTSSIKFSKNKE